jgi:hypothetical protein
MATNYRLAPLELVLQGPQANIRDTQAPQEPDARAGDIKTFRAMPAVCTNYCCFCRAGTGVRCHMDDIAVDRTGGNILLFERKAKEDQRRTAADKPLLQFPITAVPLLADLLEALTAGRTSYCNQLGTRPGPTASWAVTPDDQPHTWTAGTITEWIREACNTIGASPPTQFKWTSHSLRKGAASAAACIGAPLIRYIGG